MGSPRNRRSTGIGVLPSLAKELCARDQLGEEACLGELSCQGCWTKAGCEGSYGAGRRCWG